MRRALILCLVPCLAWAGDASLSWTAPTTNEAGDPLTGSMALTEYRLYERCGAAPYGSPVSIGPAELSAQRTSLPDGQTCYWQLSAVNADGESVRSNEVSKALPAQQLANPSAPVLVSITWQRVQPSVAFSYTGGARNSGNSASASVTHGLTINSGDLVVAYVNSNSTTAISADAGGAAFTEAIDEIPSGETARQALYWKIANGSEPSSYSFTVGSADWQVIVKVFSAPGTIVIDNAASSHTTSDGGQNYLNIGAVNGKTMAANAVSIIAGGKDNREASQAYTTADNSYTGVIGNVVNQVAGMAHRIFTTGATIGSNVRIDTADGNDDRLDETYSVHISFVESGGGGGGGQAGFLTTLGVGN